MRNYLLIAALALASLAASSQNTIKVSSFNIRYNNAGDGINSWNNRKAIATDFIKTERPDIVGMQEVLQDQLEYLISELKDYQYQGVAREDGKQKGEYAPVFYKKSRFVEKSHETIWLSPTPTVVGSVGWDAALTRIATIVVLYDKKAKQELTVINTHFDHIGVKAREESIKLLRHKVKELGPKNYMVMGDLNSLPTESAYLTAISNIDGYPPLIDVRSTSIDRAFTSNAEATFHNYGEFTKDYVIDFIFTGKTFVAKNFKVMKIKKGDVYISDHFPIVTNLMYKTAKKK